MAASDDLIAIQGFGTSHFHEIHHFDQCFEELFENNPKYRKPEVYGYRGAKINDNIVNHIINKININVPQRQVAILCFGGNNITDGQRPEDFFRHFERLVNHANVVENLHIMIVGLIPRPKTDEHTKSLFFKTNRLLNTLCEENKPKCTFVNVSKVLCENGEILTEFYAGRENNQVHLNIHGARVLAKRIFNMVKNIPKAAFN